MNNVTAIVLAAGKGSRMKAPPTKNKVTYSIHGHPLIWYTNQTLRKSNIGSVIVVVGYAAASVKQVLGESVMYVEQSEQKGTGHAVKVALTALPTTTSTVITMYGDDSAFYTPELIQQLLDSHRSTHAAMTLLTVHRSNPTGLGRILRDTKGHICGIVEEKNATPAQKRITEINTGLYCFNRVFLESVIDQLTKNPVSGEYYLTDLIAIGVNKGYAVHSITQDEESIWFGVNTPQQLQEAEMLYQRGVSI